ncbi:glycosyltransferase family 2 protein [Palleronia sp.]|uniref:glycosyltransferase family 2 protein n=1 Tax=Palleronia sp. TaxID=1940284 RepID=UPI0035C860D9
MHRAAVIIPHFNDPIRLIRCLEALVADAPCDVEIVVVDNGSAEPPEGLAAMFPGVRFLSEPRSGAAHARNRGVAETCAERLLFLDCDCVPDPGWIETALACGPDADIVGGRVALFDETPLLRTGAQAFEAVFAFDNRRYIENEGFSVTANLVTTRTVFTAVGPFRDEVSEDKDWCQRATRLGYRIAYAETLSVAHPTRADWAALVRKWHRLTEEGHALSNKTGRRISWIARALATGPSAFVHAPRLLRKEGLSVADRLAGLSVLFRLRWLRAWWMLKQSAGLPI